MPLFLTSHLLAAVIRQLAGWFVAVEAVAALVERLPAPAAVVGLGVAVLFVLTLLAVPALLEHPPVQTVVVGLVFLDCQIPPALAVPADVPAHVPERGD